MYVPLQVNRFQKNILLIVQYKYLKSCSGDFILQNLILHTRSCGTDFITQSSWVCHFHHTTLGWWKCFVPQLYQFRRGISGGPALKYFYMIHRGGWSTQKWRNHTVAEHACSKMGRAAARRNTPKHPRAIRVGPHLGRIFFGTPIPGVYLIFFDTGGLSRHGGKNKIKCYLCIFSPLNTGGLSEIIWIQGVYLNLTSLPLSCKYFCYWKPCWLFYVILRTLPILLKGGLPDLKDKPPAACDKPPAWYAGSFFFSG